VARIRRSRGAARLHMKGANQNQTTPLLGRKVGEDSTCKLNACLITGFWPRSNSSIESVCDKLSSMSSSDNNSDTRHTFDAAPEEALGDAEAASVVRDIAEVPAIEVITTAAVHLMSAAAVKCGLAAGPDAEELKDLDEARKLITALAGFVTAAAPEIGSQHAGPLRDGLRSLQLAFREASTIPDAPGKGPGEKYTGAVN
jgi:hypothetical protein